MSASIQDGVTQHHNADCTDIVKNNAGTEKVEDAPSSITSDEYPTGLKLAIIMIALNLCVFIQSLDNTIIATAIPKITDEFHSLSDVAWYGSAYFVTVGGFQPTWGKVYRYFPLKITFTMAILVFELGSLICALAPTSEALIVGRAVGGLGAAGLGSGAYLIISLSAEPSKRPLLIGLVGLSYGIASVLGPILGGVFTDRLTWRWCFWINIPIGLISWLIVQFFFHVQESSVPQKKNQIIRNLAQLDPVGTLLLTSGVISYILALQYGGQKYSWSSAQVIGLLATSATIIVVLFPIWERLQGDRAIIPGRLIRTRAAWASSAFACFFFGCYFILLYYLPIYFQSVRDRTATQSGVQNLPLIISVAVCTILSGALTSVTGTATPLAVLGSAILVIASGLVYTLSPNSPASQTIGYQILCGIGAGIAFQLPIIIGQGHTEKENMPSVTAIILCFQTLGGACFVAAAQATFINVLITTLRAKAPHIDALQVVGTGATLIRSTFSKSDSEIIVQAYQDGLKIIFALATAVAGGALVFATFNSWRRLSR